MAGEHELTPIGGGDVYIEHLHGGEFVEHTARAQAARVRAQLLGSKIIASISFRTSIRESSMYIPSDFLLESF